MSPIERYLKVGVIGAGIGGLSAAISLREAGHQVTIYERHASSASTDRTYSPTGSSLTFGANLARIIDRWGFDFSKSGTVVVEDEHIFQDDGSDELKLVKKHDFRYMKDATGYDWHICSHYGLYDGLLQLALGTPEGKHPITLHGGTKVTHFDCKAGKVTTDGGETEQFDLVVIAGGVGSRLVDFVTGDTTPAMTPGRTAYRFRVPALAVRSDPLLAPILARPSAGMTNFVAPARSIFLLVLESDARDTFFGLLMHPELANGSDADSARWDIEGSAAQLAQLAAHLHPVPRRLCELAQAPHLWTIKTRPPLQACTRGRAVAIGDAWHPHLPHHGQGAASAVEDAASLGVFLHGGIGAEDVTKRLKMWQDFRLPRATAIQMIAATYPTSLECLKDRIREECGYQGPLPENVNGHERPVQTWLFNYDVVEESRRHLLSLSSNGA